MFRKTMKKIQVDFQKILNKIKKEKRIRDQKIKIKKKPKNLSSRKFWRTLKKI